MANITVEELAKKLHVQPKLIQKMLQSLEITVEGPESQVEESVATAVSTVINQERAQRRAANEDKKKTEGESSEESRRDGAEAKEGEKRRTSKKEPAVAGSGESTPAPRPQGQGQRSGQGRGPRTGEVRQQSQQGQPRQQGAPSGGRPAGSSATPKPPSGESQQVPRSVESAPRQVQGPAPSGTQTAGPAATVAPRPVVQGAAAPARPHGPAFGPQAPAPRPMGPTPQGAPRPMQQGPQATYAPRPQGQGQQQGARPFPPRPAAQGGAPGQGRPPYPPRPQGQGQQGPRPFPPRDGQGGQRPPGQGGQRPPGQGGPRPGGQGGARSGGPGQGGARPGGPGRSGGRPGGPFIPQPQQSDKPAAPGSKMVKKDLKYSDERYRDQERILSNENQQQRESRRPGRSSGGRRGASGRSAAEQRSNTQMPSQIELAGPVTVKGLADLLKTDSSMIIKALMRFGMLMTINQEVDFETATIIATELGSKVVAPKEEFNLESIVAVEEDDEAAMQPRPPVVTVMGHVDHGKTSLLDAIRSADVASGEAGGITQHIGAYTVELSERKITFLDTPGHEAFTAMRARGAQVTDIAVLVVAADDGVMPQTVEAINHAKAAKVPIIVAINKIDKPGANPERVKQELTEHELVAEEWGGDTIMVPVSAIRGDGISLLLESILLVADIGELKANPDRRAVGTVIEAKLDKGRGPVATVLVHKGTLSIGDILVVGSTYGKIRAMVDDRGRRVRKAGPSQPVEVVGLNEVPEASDVCSAVEDERQARQLSETRAAQKKIEEQARSGGLSLDDWMKIAEVRELNLILKGDVHGSLEAIRLSLERLSTSEVRVAIVHTGVGAISESDVMLASASNAIIIGFNVRPDVNAQKVAEQQKIDIRTYRVIYEILDDVEAALKGLLAPVIKENIVAHIEIREVFHISKYGNVAGCYVTDGKVSRSSLIRVIRDGTVIHEGKIDTLKRIKDDVREVNAGYECGILLERFNDIKIGDRFEAYVMEEIKRTEL